MNPCGTRCKTCPMLKMPRKINLENKTFTLYQQGSCKIEDTVYVYICNICKDFYIGKTMTPLNIRNNNHRIHFSDGRPEKSALSQHIYKDHPGMEFKNTENFTLGILAHVNPLALSRVEDSYIRETKADTLHLNRYKPVGD